MIIVLDTNVIVSALLSQSGAPSEIFNLWEEDEFSVVISIRLLNELEHTLKYPKVIKYLKLSEEELRLFLDHFRTFASVVEPELTLEVIKNDPDDNRVLECAVAGKASYIVTGDKHLLELEEYQGIEILSPSSFLTLLTMEKKKPKK